MTGRVRAEISISVNGYGAGPEQSPEAPLGIGGERLHDWVIGTKAWRESHGREGGETGTDSEISAAMLRDVGAVVMGRGMFGGGSAGQKRRQSKAIRREFAAFQRPDRMNFQDRNRRAGNPCASGRQKQDGPAPRMRSAHQSQSRFRPGRVEEE